MGIMDGGKILPDESPVVGGWWLGVGSKGGLVTAIKKGERK
jgi:hypothetical protein